jgi:hypothetical protein
MEKAPASKVVVGGMVYGLLAASQIYCLVRQPLLSSSEGQAFLALTSAITGPFVGAAFIWATVRLTNRLNAGQFAKRPPDPP